MSERPRASEHLDELTFLVRELLLERSAKLNGAALAAYLDGWTGMLDLMRRTDLLLPLANDDVRGAVAQLVERIREAQTSALDDGTG